MYILLVIRNNERSVGFMLTACFSNIFVFLDINRNGMKNTVETVVKTQFFQLILKKPQLYFDFLT